MKLGIIGCGLIGTKRARAAAPHPVVAVFDPQRDRAEKLAAECPGARVASSVVSTRVALSPSTFGIRMSISTTSGLVWSTSAPTP